MSDFSPRPATPPVMIEVFPAEAFRVALGAGFGLGLGRAEDAVPGDIYRLLPVAAPVPMALSAGAGPPRIGPGGAVGMAGDPLRVLAEHRLLAEDGETVTVLALIVDGTRAVILPLTPLARGTDYTLLDSRATAGDLPLPERVAAAFVLGTAIVLPDGGLKPVERLARGEMILTRDHGPRPLRALLHTRCRAAGDRAPVVIAPGTIGNAAELAVSPYHRILLCRPGTGRSAEGWEQFVQARHLVDGVRIRRRETGYVDYFSLVFDAHEVIYAEGFPCESLCLTPAVAGRLPAAMAADLARGLSGLARSERPTPETDHPDLDPFRG